MTSRLNHEEALSIAFARDLTIISIKSLCQELANTKTSLERGNKHPYPIDSSIYLARKVMMEIRVLDDIIAK